MALLLYQWSAAAILLHDLTSPDAFVIPGPSFVTPGMTKIRMNQSLLDLIFDGLTVPIVEGTLES